MRQRGPPTHREPSGFLPPFKEPKQILSSKPGLSQQAE
jgi:hypothetical protein